MGKILGKLLKIATVILFWHLTIDIRKVSLFCYLPQTLEIYIYQRNTSLRPGNYHGYGSSNLNSMFLIKESIIGIGKYTRNSILDFGSSDGIVFRKSRHLC